MRRKDSPLRPVLYDVPLDHYPAWPRVEYIHVVPSVNIVGEPVKSVMTVCEGSVVVASSVNGKKRKNTTRSCKQTHGIEPTHKKW